MVNDPDAKPSSREQAVAQLEAYQKRLENALKQGENNYDAAFEDPPTGVGAHEIDLTKVLRRVNGGELRLLGYSRDQMLGRPVVQFIVMDETSRRSIEKKLSGTMELKPFVRTFRRADGSPVTFLLLDRHLRAADGTVSGIRTVLMEVEAGF
jgi:PAS domain S-box-containing protein